MKMKKMIQSKKGESYIDVAVAVVVVAFILVFAVSIFQMVTLKQDLNYMADELIKTATVSGRIGEEVEQRYAELCTETGLTPEVSFSALFFDAASRKVQLGNSITVTLTTGLTLPGFGGYMFPINATVTESGLSRIYWK